MCNYGAMDGIRANAFTLEEIVYVAKEFSSFYHVVDTGNNIARLRYSLYYFLMAFDISSLRNSPDVFPCLQSLKMEYQKTP